MPDSKLFMHIISYYMKFSSIAWSFVSSLKRLSASDGITLSDYMNVAHKKTSSITNKKFINHLLWKDYLSGSNKCTHVYIERGLITFR